MIRILCVGARSNPKKNNFTGQTIMFDGMLEYFDKKGVDTTIVDLLPKKSNPELSDRIFDYILALAKIFYYLLSNRYDVAYLITAQSRKGFIRDYAIVSMCKWFNVPVVTHQYGANYKQLIDSLNVGGLRRLTNMLEYVRSVIVEGDYMKEQFSILPDYQKKVITIPNGLPIEGKRMQIPKKYIKNEPFRMFYLSNLIWSKGYSDVLKAVDILVNKDHLDVKCVFAGKFMVSHDDERPGISNKEEFDQYIKEHQLSERIEYYPGLYGDKKEEYFCKSNVFLLPTYYINEGQPVSVIEAMAYGCVPLVTEYRHIPMMINERNGCYVKPKDAEDIARNVKYLMEHPEEYAAKSKQCIIDYYEKFKFNVYAGKVMGCINAVIK